uniref:Cytochrome b5 heme-binding domain-containing protein n=1 Tax=Panagrellus redivivus TaxID=6233 RepID=A0A7E4ZWT9_PANRE
MVEIGSVLEISYFDIALLVVLVYVVYRMFLKKADPLPPPPKRVPPLPKQDMTVEQLRKYNGTDDEHICIALLGEIFDVTRGKNFYGPDTAYAPLAGHDATRALANMDLKLVQEEYDDPSTLSEVDKDEAKNWADTFRVKYPVVGRLLAPGEEPKDYKGEEATM